MLLYVQNLSVHFSVGTGIVQPVQNVSFHVNKGEILGLVGESGSGKSVTSLAAMGLLPARNSHVSGSLLFEGQELVGATERTWRGIRGSQIAMIFQDPSSCLNPVRSIGGQLIEAVRLTRSCSNHEAESRALRLLQRVGIAEARRRMKEYPHQLSGGMNQRVMIAMALAGSPKLLMADEPTTALDVTIQAQILDLLQELAVEEGMAIILVTHDLGVVAQTANRVAVMYAGRIVEQGPVKNMFAMPAHPYTKALLAASPRIDKTLSRLETIPGSIPSLLVSVSGCSFAERCTRCLPECHTVAPALSMFAQEHLCACHHPVSIPSLQEPADEKQLTAVAENRSRYFVVPPVPRMQIQSGCTL